GSAARASARSARAARRPPRSGSALLGPGTARTGTAPLRAAALAVGPVVVAQVWARQRGGPAEAAGLPQHVEERPLAGLGHRGVVAGGCAHDESSPTRTPAGRRRRPRTRS